MRAVRILVAPGTAVMMIIGSIAMLMRMSVAGKGVVVHAEPVAVMPERHANPRAHGRDALDRDGQGQQSDGKHAEQASGHSGDCTSGILSGAAAAGSAGRRISCRFHPD